MKPHFDGFRPMLTSLVFSWIFVAAAQVVPTLWDTLWDTAKECLGDCDEPLELLQLKADKWQSASQSSIEGSRERVPYDATSVLATCSPDQFQSSLAWLIENRLIKENNITSLAQANYLNIAERQRCKLGPEWWTSQKPLIFNVGEGSTATHMVHDIMSDLGFKSVHWNLDSTDPSRTEADWVPPILGSKNEDVNGSTEVDEWEVLSDTPIPYLTWELLQSHPNALFLMTMRDPMEWQTSRVFIHDDKGPQAIPCGDSLDLNLMYGAPTAPQTYVAYSAWVACVVPADRLLAFNVFESNDSEFSKKLIPFLEAHGLQKPDWEARTALVKAKAHLGHYEKH